MGTAKYDFSGQTALVIGATAGIGRATALAFADAGANVVAAGLGAEEGKSLAAEIEGRGRAALFIEADVRRESDMDAVMEAAVSRFGRIHAAVNNAGVECTYGPMYELSSEEFDKIIGINLKGVWLGLKRQIPHMLAHGGGTIVNTASTAGITGMANIAVYTASKHGIVGLTKAAALEVGKSNIRINAVAPGPVRTGLLDRMVAGHVEVSAIGASNPMGRISEPEAIASAILYLSSDASSYVLGHVLAIDGGFTVP